jgi:hypothetical protein
MDQFDDDLQLTVEALNGTLRAAKRQKKVRLVLSGCEELQQY